MGRTSRQVLIREGPFVDILGGAIAFVSRELLPNILVGIFCGRRAECPDETGCQQPAGASRVPLCVTGRVDDSGMVCQSRLGDTRARNISADGADPRLPLEFSQRAISWLLGASPITEVRVGTRQVAEGGTWTFP